MLFSRYPTASFRERDVRRLETRSLESLADRSPTRGWPCAGPEQSPHPLQIETPEGTRALAAQPIIELCLPCRDPSTQTLFWDSPGLLDFAPCKFEPKPKISGNLSTKDGRTWEDLWKCEAFPCHVAFRGAKSSVVKWSILAENQFVQNWSLLYTTLKGGRLRRKGQRRKVCFRWSPV